MKANHDKDRNVSFNQFDDFDLRMRNLKQALNEIYHNQHKKLIPTRTMVPYKHAISGQIAIKVFILALFYLVTNDSTIDSTPLQDTLFNDSSLDLFPSEDSSKCELMRIPFCDKVPYNRTMLPNFLGHTTQLDVESDINIYDPLVKSECSPDLRLFLCTVYAPICFDHDHEIVKLKPCRSLCESARQGCAIRLSQIIHMNWPKPLSCDQFPVGGPDVLCVGNDSHMDPPDHEQPHRNLSFVCPRNFEVNSYHLHLNGRKYNNCAMPCEGVYLDKGSTRNVRLTIGTLAIICLISSIFTCFTFFIDTKRFQYPARPIIIIAFCQLIVATCFLIGFLTHNKIACNDPVEPPKNLPNMRMIRSMTMGNKKGSCTLLFMTLYFFQLSTVMWWLMMTISWYMIAKLKWAPEAVSSVSRYFHFTSWTISALFTIYLSVLGDIEGDTLSGTCFIGVSNEESVRTFLLVPITICLTLGCVLLATGFKSIWDMRLVLRSKYGAQTDPHIKLVFRIGLYSLFFILFSFIFVYSHYYELSNQTTWKMAWLSNVCKIRDYSIPCPTQNYASLGPHYLIFVIKYAATMAIGVISALFMVSEKTYRVYREVAGECINMNSSK